MNEKKVALVTGVSSGIGRATAALLMDRGFRAFGTVRDMKRATEFPAGLELVRLDVREEESIRSCVQAVLDQAGRIDSLVNNAGCTLMGALEETSTEEAKAIFETNFFGVLRMCQAVLPIMRKEGGGRIINISSVLGFLPGPYQGIYTASKHALEGYSESLDHEVRRFGIRVSLIEPAFTRTSLSQNARYALQALGAYADERKHALEAIDKGIATGVHPAAVASVVLDALTSRSPRLRYPAGREAKLLSRLRKFAPSRLFDHGLRKQFGLRAA